MRKLTIAILLFALSPFMLTAQDDLERPKNIGVADFDNFKNSSFDIKDESATLKESVTQIDNEIKNYSGVMNTISVEKIKTNLKALKDSKEAVATLTNRISSLDEKSKALLENAKNLKPKTKSIGATKNTNKSVKGLGVAKEDLKGVTDLLEADIKLLKDELTSRGEPIE